MFRVQGCGHEGGLLHAVRLQGSCRRGLVDSMVRGYNRLLGQLQKGLFDSVVS